MKRSLRIQGSYELELDYPSYLQPIMDFLLKVIKFEIRQVYFVGMQPDFVMVSTRQNDPSILTKKKGE